MRKNQPQKLSVITLNILSYILPDYVVHRVCNRWFATVRTKRFKRQFAALEPDNTLFSHTLTADGLHHYCWPGQKGMRILCVHGWSGWGLQFSDFARLAQVSELSVSSYDGPAHGASDGGQTNLIELRQALLAFVDQYGPFDVIVAHSYGLVVTLAAIEAGLKTRAVVSIAGPSSLYPQVEKFINYYGYSKRVGILFEKRIVQLFGPDWWIRNAPVNQLAGRNLSGLILHDSADPLVPVEEAMTLHRNWQGSSLYLTNHLGHHKILSDHSSIKEIIWFIERIIS